MAETRQQDTPGTAAAGRERGGRTGQDAARTAAAQTRQGGEAAAEAGQRGGQAAATAVRTSAETGAETGAETMRRSGEAANEVARRSAQEFAAGGRRMAESAAHGMEESAERTAEAMRRMAHDMSQLLMMPRSTGGGLQEMQDAMSQLMNGVMRTNLRVTQEILRRANPGAVVELQGSLMRDYLETLVEGGVTMLRVTRRTADEALRPLEERLQRRAGEAGQERGGRSQDGPCVADVMTREVRVVHPDETVQQAARLLGEADAGAIPVGENDRLVGMITDRDLAVRVLGEGKDPARTKVRDVMTPGSAHVFEDQDLHSAAESMRGHQLRCMPVLNRDKRLVGIASLSDLAREVAERQGIGRAMSGPARERGGQDRQGQAPQGQGPGRR